jgi:hypothetical protein
METIATGVGPPSALWLDTRETAPKNAREGSDAVGPVPSTVGERRPSSGEMKI